MKALALRAALVALMLVLAFGAYRAAPQLTDMPYLSEFPELAALAGVFLVLTLASVIEERLRSRSLAHGKDAV